MKSITQRRIFSLLLSLAMLVGLLPALGSIASAAGSGTTEGDPRIVTTYGGAQLCPELRRHLCQARCQH